MWLPRLLDSVVGHPLANEIIVVDNNSSDQTVAIAKEYGCLVERGGLPGLSRNIGARLAQSEMIAFVDADALVPHPTLDTAIRVLSTTDSLLYHCPLVPLSQSVYIRFFYWIMDRGFRALRHTPFRQGVGSFVAVRRSEFLEIGGFDEHLTAGEDADLVRRMGRLGRISYDTGRLVYVSSRRFSVENPVWFALKTMLWSILRLTPTRASAFDYSWKRYPERLFHQEAKYLASNSRYRTAIR